ncbi:MAG: hypothetical protein P8179_19890 [Candidatus Thiodiazotropha sp.]
MSKYYYGKQSAKSTNSRLVSIFLSGALLVPSVAFSGRAINLPMEEKFDTTSYQRDLIWISDGAHHEWVPHGGWHGTGAAKFYPPTLGDGGYAGIGQLERINGGRGATQLNIRFLVFHGPDWGNVRTVNKVAIMNRAENFLVTRPMFISWYNEEGGWRSLGACNGTVCNYHGGDYWPNEDDTFRIGPENRLGEWISVECETNTITGKMKVYIYTQDGEEHGLYAEQDMKEATSPYGPGTTPIHYVDIIGGYFNKKGLAQYTDDAYYIIDELKVDDSYIGPPTGFIKTPNRIAIKTFTKASQPLWQTVGLPEQFIGTPILLSQMQSCNGSDTASMRIKNNRTNAVDLLVEEEHSFDAEYGHADEVIGLLGLGEGKIIDQSGLVVGEAGLVSVNAGNANDWRTLTFSREYSDPVILMQMNTFNGSQAAHMRLRNVSTTNAQYHIEEWDYLNGFHVPETVGYIVLERGTHLLNSGKIIQAGSISANHAWVDIGFQDLGGKPVVFSQSQTYNGNQAVVTRQRNISSNSFQMRLQEEEANDDYHAVETVGYLIIR